MLKKLISMALVSLILMSLIFSNGIVAHAAGATYYVDATNGDDTRTLAQAQNVNTPWKTIQKAASVVAAGDTCLIRGGVYQETVTPLNSGTSGSPITFKPYQNEIVTINGGDMITSSWTQYLGNIYKTNVTMSLGSRNAIYYNNQMMMPARWPNSNEFLSKSTEVINNTSGGTDDTHIYDPNMPDVNGNDAKVFVFGSWWGWTSPISGYTNKKITFTNNSPDEWCSVTGAIGLRGSFWYYIVRLDESRIR